MTCQCDPCITPGHIRYDYAGMTTPHNRPSDANKNVPSYTYAVHFSKSGVLKVGYSTQCDEYSVKGVNLRFQHKFCEYYETEPGIQIWRRHGDMAQESYINVRMSIRFNPAAPHTGKTLNEWWMTGRNSVSALTHMLDDWVYELGLLT